jgi:hypothetical protein
MMRVAEREKRHAAKLQQQLAYAEATLQVQLQMAKAKAEREYQAELVAKQKEKGAQMVESMKADMAAQQRAKLAAIEQQKEHAIKQLKAQIEAEQIKAAEQQAKMALNPLYEELAAKKAAAEHAAAQGQMAAAAAAGAANGNIVLRALAEDSQGQFSVASPARSLVRVHVFPLASCLTDMPHVSAALLFLYPRSLCVCA